MTALFYFFFLSGLFITAAISNGRPSKYQVDEYIFHTRLDHNNFRPNATTLPLYYYVHQEHYTEDGPCFFYAGNEADIFQFINNTGFMFEAAVEFQALVVFAEHRYYGWSQPHHFDSHDVMSYLTVEQAMMDFDMLNVHIRKKWSMPTTSPFIVFGGSYGANLAMWLRLKNSNLWAGAIASSATPLKHLLRETNAFAAIETEVYANVSKQCPLLVREGWHELFAYARTSAGRARIADALGLCQPLVQANEADWVHGWVGDALETLVQYGYPYPTDFYEPVPAYPFRVACEQMLAANTGLGALRAATSVFFNWTGQAGSCFDFERHILPRAERYWIRKGNHDRLHRQESRLATERQLTSALSDIGMNDAWDYQTCTEVYQPMPTNGVTDFEIPYSPDQQQYYARCQKRWGVQPRPNWEEIMFMGSHIHGGSNIFLSSGQLDPWRAAGIQKDLGVDSIIVRTIENGAHHLDLRASHPDDPPSVQAVRIEEKNAIKRWIDEWRETHKEF